MQQQPVSDTTAEAAAAAAAEAGLPPPSDDSLLTDVSQFGRAGKNLLAAQWQLFKAEVGLAQSAMVWLLVAGMAAFLLVNAAVLTLNALIAVALAQWIGSWVAALAIVLGLQLLFILASVLFCRRCLRWMSLPATRNQLHAIIGDFKGEVRRQSKGGEA